MIIKLQEFYTHHKYTSQLLILDILISLFGCLTLLITQQESWFLIFLLLLSLQLFLHIVYLYQEEKKIITFPIIFIILSNVFHFGHIPIKALGNQFGKNILFPLWYINFSTYKLSALFALLSQTMFFWGIVFIYFQLKKQRKTYSFHFIQLFSKVTLKQIRVIGYICLFIGIIPTLYIDVSKLILFIQGGYTNTFNLNVHDFVEVIANFTHFSVFALIIGFSKKKRIVNSIFFITILYKVIMMSSGGRGEAIVFLIGLFIVWESFVYNLNLKQIVGLFVIGYFGLVLINFIASARTITQFNLNQIGKIFLNSLSHNQIISALSEFGSTFSTVCFTINSNPDPTYGLNYLLPIVLILPNIGGFNSGVVDQMIFTKHIYTFKQPIGGSYIGELFYSFHWFGWIFAFILGCLIGYIAFQMRQSKNEKNYFLYLIISYSVPLLLFWIRGYFGAVYREYIWHCGFALLLIFVFKEIKERYIERN